MLRYLQKIINVSKLLELELNRLTETIKIEKNQTLLRVNERCNQLYFINKGLLRGYYLGDGKEITHWFAQEDEFATSFYAFIAEKPSFETIQALEDSELVMISYQNLQSLYKKFPETERVGRIITETYYVKLEERLLSLQFKTAKERYAGLMQNKPSLLQRAPLGHIASYLGITQETLSRIRAEV